MAKRFNAAQFRSKIRQIEQKQRAAVNKYNQEVRRYNQRVKTAVNNYNREVRAHNARVRANRQRIKNEIARLNRQSVTVSQQYSTYRASVETMHESYLTLEGQAESREFSPNYNRVLDLSERETANSLEAANRVFGDEGPREADSEGALENTEMLDRLQRISPDLDERWKGALFSLNPRNPDAARHFCTSSREIITQMLEIKAPDEAVFSLLPDCEKTERGNPTRRSRIRYFLHRNGMREQSLEDFVENDINSIVQLFRVFNEGTHGAAGKFDHEALQSIRKRVEDGIVFLSEVIGDA